MMIQHWLASCRLRPADPWFPAFRRVLQLYRNAAGVCRSVVRSMASGRFVVRRYESIESLHGVRVERLPSTSSFSTFSTLIGLDIFLGRAQVTIHLIRRGGRLIWEVSCAIRAYRPCCSLQVSERPRARRMTYVCVCVLLCTCGSS